MLQKTTKTKFTISTANIQDEITVFWKRFDDRFKQFFEITINFHLNIH